jgi:hypothetical protein
LRPVVICFVWGGVLGVVVAGILEFDVARRLGVLYFHLRQTDHKRLVNVLYHYINATSQDQQGSWRLLKSAT